VIPYTEVLKGTMVHGPKRVGIQLFVVPAGCDANDPNQCVIDPPLFNPDDVSTIKGKVIHFNQICMISASTKFHHEKSGSFPLSLREKVRFDMNTILCWPPLMVLFVVLPDEFAHESLDYPTFLEADCIGSYPTNPYINIDRQLDNIVPP
jgi:hypothetical protein